MMLLEHTLVTDLPVVVVTIKFWNVTKYLPSVNDGGDLWNVCWC
jgi:hypothetical protein